MVRQTGRSLIGPPPTELIDEIPTSDMRAALIGVIPDLQSDLADDTTNVLLTLARVWHTLETGSFSSKDAAADWALALLPPLAHPPLELARDVYLGVAVDDWSDRESEADSTTSVMVDRIKTKAGAT
jgi:Aminoglycoside adenylyltransferase, C-terminal domain